MSPETIKSKLKELDERPDDAIIADPVAAELLDISLRTLRRRNPVPRVQLSPNRVGRRLGDVRVRIRGGLVQPAA
jgi:hypothetical protein